MATPAAILSILVTANTAQATTALGKTQTQLQGTAATATKSSAVMKKALLGVGLAAGAAGVALFKVGEEFDDAYDKIRTRTGATGKEMVKLKRIFRDVVSDVPASFDEASTAVGDLNTRLGLTGRPLGKMAKQMTELSRITETDVSENVKSVSRAFVDWEVSTKDQTKTLDGFFRLSQKSGMAVSAIAESVQQFGSPLRQLGFSLDEAAAMFANFERAGINTETMVPGLKLAISNLTRPTSTLGASMEKLEIAVGKPEKALRQVFALMSGNTISSVEKTGLAMDVFGRRAGADMAEAIEQGRFELDEFMKVMRDGDGTIRETGRKTMDLGEHWQQFTNILKLQVEPIAKKVFKGLGRLMGEVTQAFKKEGLQGVVNLLLDKLGNAVPKIMALGGKLAGALFKGIMQAPLETKLLAAGLFGGVAAWKAVGRKLGGGVARGVALGLIFFLPDLVVQAFNFGKKIGHAIEDKGAEIGEWFVNGLIDVVNNGIDNINTIMDELNVLGKFGVDAPNIGEIGHVDFTPQIRAFKMLREQGPEALAQAYEDAGKTAAEASAKAGRKWHELYATTAHTTERTSSAVRDGWSDISRKVVGETAQARDKGGRNVRELAVGADRHTKQAAEAMGANVKVGSQKVLGELARAKTGGKKSTSDLASGVALNIFRLASAVGAGMLNIQQNTKGSLGDFGVKFAGYAIKKIGNALGFQSGGIMVPGQGSGDKVRAMLEPGEVVWNREAVRKMGGARKANAINQAIPRFASGGVAGGLNFALGPYDVPPIQYAADHAGGNSHVHVTGTTTPWVVALGRQLQGMGFMVGEHPAFGGVQAQHSATGGHYDALAIDINSAADETRAEVASIARLLGGAGGMGAVAELIKRVMLKGPKGPLLDLGQGALDKVRSAANKYISKQSPSGIAPTGGSFAAGPGALSRPEMRSLMGKVGLPDIFGYIAEAESGLNPMAHNASGASGLWQIMMPLHSALVDQAGGNVFDPLTNAKVASMLSGGGSSLAPWVESQGGWGSHVGQAYQKGGVVQKPGWNQLVPGGGGGGVNWPNFTGPGIGGGGAGGVGGPKPGGGGGGHGDGGGGGGFDLAGALGSRESVAKLIDRIKAVGLHTDVQTQLTKLGEASDIAEEMASRASSLTIDPITEDGKPILGALDGLNEVQWLGKALESLFGYRNLLISAQAGQASRVGDLGGLLERARNRLAEIADAIRKAEKEYRDLQRKLERAKTDKAELERQLDRARGVLETEKAKPERRNNEPRRPNRDRDPRRIAAAQDEVNRLGGKLGVNAVHREDLRRRMEAVAERREAGERKSGWLGEKIVPAITDHRDLLKDSGPFSSSELLGFLESVQGIGSPMEALTALPAVGVLGGRIFDIQMRLRDLNQPRETITDSGAASDVSQSALDSLRADLLGDQLAEARRSNAILRAQMPVFGGVFHNEGVVPGPIGADRMILAQGGEVVSKGKSTINVYVDPVSLDTRVEEIVNGRLVQVVRGAATRGGVTGSKAGRYG